MNCLKCSREIEEGQVFCEECLADMQNYPVKPNIAIQLPHRESHATAKKVPVKRRQAPSPEEKLKSMKRYLRRMIILWLITLGLLIVSLVPAVRYLMGDSVRLPGQNYSTFPTAHTETTAPGASTTTP